MSLFKFLLAATALMATVSAAQAGSYSVQVVTGVTGGAQFDSLSTSPFAGKTGTASASFTYTGDLVFDNTTAQNAPPPAPLGDLNSAFGFSTANVSNYSGSGTVSYGGAQVANFGSLASFLASSGSASGFTYGSWYAVDLGVLAKGTILTVTHDDGVSLYQGGTRIGSTTAGPTTRKTEVVTLAADGDTMLYYGRQNGTPSTLIVAVPEPVSMALLGGGLLGLGLVRRARRG